MDIIDNGPFLVKGRRHDGNTRCIRRMAKFLDGILFVVVDAVKAVFAQSQDHHPDITQDQKARIEDDEEIEEIYNRITHTSCCLSVDTQCAGR